MAIDLDDFDFDDLQNYPNVGYNKDEELVLFSYNGNPKVRPSNSKLLLTAMAEQEIIKCRDDIYYFIENYVYIISPGEGLIIPKIRDYQRETIDLYSGERYVLNKSARRSGKTASATMYLAHKFIFKDNFTIGVVANQAKLVGEIVNNIKNIILALPPFLQHGIVKMNQTSIELSNGSKIISSIISGNAMRGIDNVDITYCDEFSFADPSKVDAFMDSIFPVISASPKNQIIITTTPKGRDTFARLWQESEDGLNDFKRISVKWDRIPGKDEAWKKAEIARVGPELFLQNHEVEFIGSSKTLLSKEGLLNLKRKNPLIEDYIYDDVKLYKEYDENANYIISIDTARTTGKDFKNNDYIALNMNQLNEKTIEQVLVYRTRDIHYTELAQIVYDLAEVFDFPEIICENNESTSLYTLNYLKDTLEYPGEIYHDPLKDGTMIGVRTTKLNRTAGLLSLKELIEKDIFKIYDEDTINEFYTFIKQGKDRWEASASSHDDLIMSLCIFMYYLLDEDNDLEITIDEYLEGSVLLQSKNEDNDLDFMGSSQIDDEDLDWLRS